MEKINDLVTLLTVADTGADLLCWLQSNEETIGNLLMESPAVLFRGFTEFSAEKFSQFSALYSDPLDYIYQSTPRTLLNKGIYTATEYPKESTIPQHCENAYQNSWPLRLNFYCDKAAVTGGETPLGDMRKITSDISLDIKEKFTRYGVMYVRNYAQGLDIPWQTVFQTSNKQDVEAYCKQNGLTCEWQSNDSLRTVQVCQALARHPKTKERLWFNQVHLFHVSNLEPAIKDTLLSMYAEKDLPRNAYYGNGDPIETDLLDEVRDIFDKNKSAFSWQDNDILIIDNMLCSHGRNPFTGERKVMVSMNTPYMPEINANLA